MKKFWKRTFFIGGPLVIFGWLWLTCVYFLEATDVALSRSIFGSRVEYVQRTGWHLKPPWDLVSIIDTRPTRVCLTSAAHAAFNCKLVRFVPAEWEAFLRVEGFGLYWWANRFSINTGYREEYRGMEDILRGYSFSSERYPFIQVLEDYQGMN